MPVPVLTVAQMREWEAATWRSGQTETEVIRQVGRALAERALRLTHAGDLVLLLAGKGHNGDDVRAAREHLALRAVGGCYGPEAGRRVELLNVDGPTESQPALEEALQRRPALVVDGLFGIGLNRPLDDGWQRFITRLNQAGLRVLAVDVPSGLNADTGETFGAAIEASLTLTVGAPKHGLLAAAAWPFVGRLEVATEVGLLPCPIPSETQWALGGDFAAFPPARLTAGHKGSFGHLAIIAGSVGYHGAAVLAAHGAQRAQPGLITVFTPETAYHAVAPQLLGAMLKPWSTTEKLPGEFSALLIGPGLAAANLPEELKMIVRKLWRDSLVPVIVDASALDWLPLDPVPKGAIRVITPHPGEAGRLHKTTPARIQANRPQALREISKNFGHCWVVLKGHQTLVGRSTGEIFVNSSGNPHLAQGGSGDLLAGYLAGLLAQPRLQADPARTLRYAVWQHGAAADALQARRANWIIEDLASELGDVRP